VKHLMRFVAGRSGQTTQRQCSHINRTLGQLRTQAINTGDAA